MKNLSDFQPYQIMYVDAMNLLSRSHYGMPMLEYKGRKTGMLMGVARLIIEWRKKNPALRIVFIWEGRNNWRKEKHPIYKAQRKKDRALEPSSSRKAFHDAIGLVKESLPTMGVDQVLADRHEADDTVWTVMWSDEGKKLFVSTDWDWWSLVDHGDILYENAVLTETELQSKFTKKFNCEPIPMERMWVFKALTGDPSDNVSGVPRFPKKLGAILAADRELGENDLIHGIIIHGSPKWAEKTIANKWVLERNLELIKIDPPPVDELEWLKAPTYEAEAFGDVLLKSGMGNLYDRLTGGQNG